MESSRYEDKATKAATDTIAAVGDFADDTKIQVDGFVNRAAAAADKAYGQARDQVRGATASVAKSVEQQPGIALLVVGLFCGALGYLLARR